MAIGNVNNVGAYHGTVDIQPVSVPAGNGGKTDLGSNGKVARGEAAIVQIQDAIAEINNKSNTTRCEYSVDKETNRILIRVFDKATNEVICEIPPEECLDMLAKIWELAGLIVDEKR